MGGSEKKSRQIALAERGQCEFAIKAINAQAAGYKALIILDSKNDETDFSRYIQGFKLSLSYFKPSFFKEKMAF